MKKVIDTDITCPYCSTKTKKLQVKKWKYSNTEVVRYQCECGRLFNFYKGKKSTWTIPKTKNE